MCEKEAALKEPPDHLCEHMHVVRYMTLACELFSLKKCIYSMPRTNI